jgi:hypothetical protein
VNARRKALIVANDEYEQEQLRDLLAPAADAEALDRVLSDARIGDFAVQVIRNQPAHDIAARIEDLFAESRPDDLLLLHYSGHGIKSESGELFLAASNTRPTRLRATAVSADFVLQCMRDSRSRSIVLLLDCCYAGAFPQGVRGAGRAGGQRHPARRRARGGRARRGRAAAVAGGTGLRAGGHGIGPAAPLRAAARPADRPGLRGPPVGPADPGGPDGGPAERLDRHERRGPPRGDHHARGPGRTSRHRRPGRRHAGDAGGRRADPAVAGPGVNGTVLAGPGINGPGVNGTLLAGPVVARAAPGPSPRPGPGAADGRRGRAAGRSGRAARGGASAGG